MKYKVNFRPSKSQLDKLSDISISIGQVCFASAFVDRFFTTSSSGVGMFFGLLVSFMLWSVSIIVVKNN